MAQPIPAQRHYARERDIELLARGWDARDKPGHFLRVREAEDELVDDAVDADSARDEGERCVGRVGENEVVRVEGGEAGLAYTTATESLVSVTWSPRYLMIIQSI